MPAGWGTAASMPLPSGMERQKANGHLRGEPAQLLRELAPTAVIVVLVAVLLTLDAIRFLL